MTTSTAVLKYVPPSPPDDLSFAQQIILAVLLLNAKGIIDHHGEPFVVLEKRPFLRLISSLDRSRCFWIRRNTTKERRSFWREENIYRMQRSRGHRTLEKPPCYQGEAKPAATIVPLGSRTLSLEERIILARDLEFPRYAFGSIVHYPIRREPDRVDVPFEPDSYTKGLFQKAVGSREGKYTSAAYDVIVNEKTVREVSREHNYNANKHRSFKTQVSKYREKMAQIEWQESKQQNAQEVSA
jgi:hypothetical protein